MGKEAALFVPSGTMANQIAIKLHTQPAEEIITEKDSHIFYYETAGMSFISGVQPRLVDSENGEMSIEELEKAVRPDVYYFPKTSLLCLENTHNRKGGTVLSLAYIEAVSSFAIANSLKMHLDGARLWNASLATGISLAKYSQFFDTVSVCLSKGLGAPVGSLLAGTKENIIKARKIRKILGGGMRQAGMLAAAGLYAIQHNFAKMARDHHNTKAFSILLDASGHFEIMSEPQTNILKFKPVNENISSLKLIEMCVENNLLLSYFDDNVIRAVFHLDIKDDEIEKAADILIAQIEILTKK